MEARPVKVVALQISPEAVYPGQAFVIRAQTDSPARAVALLMDGLSHTMEGSGKQWQYRQTIGEIGRKEFAVVAKNIEDRPGPEQHGEVIIQRRPLPLAEKRVARIGLAEVNRRTCLPLAGREACQLCVDECQAAGYDALEFIRVGGDISPG